MTAQRDSGSKPRHLKVGYSNRDAPAPSSASQHVPQLRLCGRWLEEAGFTIGRSVRVEVSEGRLTIEPADF